MAEAVNAYPTAPVALILSVLMTFVIFSALPAYRAAFLTLLVAALVLPVGYGWFLPGFTMLDKATIPLFSAIAACLAIAPGELGYMRLRGPTLLFVAGIVLGPLITASTNGDAYVVGGTHMPGLGLLDGMAISRRWVFPLVLPFLLGRTLVRTPAQLEQLLRPLVVAFVIYSLPMLWEIRMSPQLHTIVYGYFPHSFVQQARSGGFRPVVFVGHGLPLAILTSFAALANSMLWREGKRIRGLSPKYVAGYLGVVLVLCKTFSAVIYASVGSLLMFFCAPKTQVRIAVVIACIVLAYPILRSFDLFPIEALTELSDSASEERAESLAFRFDNEHQLLERARERWFFGWGSYGRNRPIDEEGKSYAVTDGLWIILLGEVGAVGFVSAFGLMLSPIFQCRRALRNMSSESSRRLLGSMAILIALNWADSLPNALSGGVLMVFMTGAFSGVVATYQVPPRRRVRDEETALRSSQLPAAVPTR